MKDENFKWKICRILCRKAKHGTSEKIGQCLWPYRAVNHNLEKEILITTTHGFTRRFRLTFADDYRTYPLPLTNYSHY